jgi:hypothetical protein
MLTDQQFHCISLQNVLSAGSQLLEGEILGTQHTCMMKAAIPKASNGMTLRMQ